MLRKAMDCLHPIFHFLCRNIPKPEVAKCRGGGPPVRGIFSGSDQTCVVSSPVQVYFLTMFVS